MQTCLVQVPRQLDRRLRLHVVLEEAATERGLVVGLARLGLDGLLVPGLRHLRRHGPDAARRPGRAAAWPRRSRPRWAAPCTNPVQTQCGPGIQDANLKQTVCKLNMIGRNLIQTNNKPSLNLVSQMKPNANIMQTVYKLNTTE